MKVQVQKKLKTSARFNHHLPMFSTAYRSIHPARREAERKFQFSHSELASGHIFSSLFLQLTAPLVLTVERLNGNLNFLTLRQPQVTFLVSLPSSVIVVCARASWIQKMADKIVHVPKK